jgi:hypothetical protein
MKKLFALMLALVLALSLAACGEKDNNSTPSGNGGNGTTTPSTSQGGNNNVSAKLTDIKDDQISTEKLGIPVDGSDRTAMLAKIPAEIKKGIGTIKTAIIKPEGDGYMLSFEFSVSSEDDYKAMKDYYKSLGCTVTNDDDMLKNFMADFSWGYIVNCTYYASAKDVAVSFMIN